MNGLQHRIVRDSGYKELIPYNTNVKSFYKKAYYDDYVINDIIYTKLISYKKAICFIDTDYNQLEMLVEYAKLTQTTKRHLKEYLLQKVGLFNYELIIKGLKKGYITFNIF